MNLKIQSDVKFNRPGKLFNKQFEIQETQIEIFVQLEDSIKVIKSDNKWLVSTSVNEIFTLTKEVIKIRRVFIKIKGS
jgi:hypothetical protein